MDRDRPDHPGDLLVPPPDPAADEAPPEAADVLEPPTVVSDPGRTPARFMFDGPSGRLSTTGIRTRLAPRPGESLGDAAERVLAEAGPDEVLVGAVGFDDAEHALVVPEDRRWGADPDVADPTAPAPEDAAPIPPTDLPPTAPAALGTRFDVRAEPTPATYAAAVLRALGAIDEGLVEKVVLSRTLAVTAPEEIDIGAVLARLAAAHRSSYVFAADLDGDRSLVGASPELLLSRRGRTVVSNPLAGTVPRSPDPEEDARRADRLAASGKDRHEHALVVAQVAERLAPFCRHLDVPEGPELTATDSLWHLSTRITGELADPAPSSLRIATALHPTAAVCGAPTDDARVLIGALEGVPRGYYTGLVGWCDASGDGEWAVTIRCAEVSGRHARLHAGAGIVAGSVPEAEVAETTAKLRPLLDALGLEAAP
ncbi:isochorismate synthase [Actinomycetospora termitidis]|uniref:isochorismate synthase n=1 Tax=Actinomycetospora termitidis TaxID=3053470 RepID=A0ABT7MH75_9PSEU|nr:isochorismate synthase [Actinomycetospora sp. Odt1-22]MDL5159524.1 isochorismate synthase [Actinomycetospora sp. Odt1-22]